MDQAKEFYEENKDQISEQIVTWLPADKIAPDGENGLSPWCLTRVYNQTKQSETLFVTKFMVYAREWQLEHHPDYDPDPTLDGNLVVTHWATMHDMDLHNGT